MVAKGSAAPTIGPRLKAYRLARGLTQAKLAGAEYSVAYISRIEAGERTPSPEALAHIAGRLGISPADLLSPLDERTRVELEHLRLTVTRALDASSWDEAMEASERLVELGTAHDAPEFVAFGTRAMGEATEQLGNVERAIEFYRQAQAAGTDLTVENRVEIVVSIARAYRTLGDFGHAADLLERALAELRPEAGLYPALAARLSTHLASTYHERGDLVRSREIANEGLEHARAADDPRTLANALWAAAPPVAAADPARALSLIRRAGTLYAELGHRLELGRLYGATGDIAVMAGDRDAARAAYERSLELMADAGTPSALARTLESIATLEVEEGNIGAAVEAARRALDLARTSDPYTVAHCSRTLGRALTGVEPTEAERLLRDSVERFERAGAHLEVAKAYRYLGELYIKAGREDEALKAFRHGLGVVEGAA